MLNVENPSWIKTFFSRSRAYSCCGSKSLYDSAIGWQTLTSKTADRWFSQNLHAWISNLASCTSLDPLSYLTVSPKSLGGCDWDTICWTRGVGNNIAITTTTTTTTTTTNSENHNYNNNNNNYYYKPPRMQLHLVSTFSERNIPQSVSHKWWWWWWYYFSAE